MQTLCEAEAELADGTAAAAAPDMPSYDKMKAGPSFLVIRTVSDGHCARGGQRCKKCKAAETTMQICLLRLFLQPSGHAARVQMATHEGKKVMCEYEREKTFASADEARAFAAENDVADVQIR